MTVFNMGSINIDHVYTMPHLVRPGETLSAVSYQTALGGKGANQSIAIARAGGKVIHGGMINEGDSGWLDVMSEAGVDISHVIKGQVPSGHAIVAVDENSGDNQIMISPSSNAMIPDDLTAAMLSRAQIGDWALAQNETNATKTFLTAAKNKALRICYSAAPFVADVTAELLPLVDLLIVNEIEAAALSDFMAGEINTDHLVITKGAKGAHYHGLEGSFDIPAPKVDPVDTTGAGDTYLGYALAGLDGGMEMRAALLWAAQAAALQVTRHGASAAIPYHQDLLKPNRS
jgi:ribokinase